MARKLVDSQLVWIVLARYDYYDDFCYSNPTLDEHLRIVNGEVVMSSDIVATQLVIFSDEGIPEVIEFVGNPYFEKREE